MRKPYTTILKYLMRHKMMTTHKSSTVGSFFSSCLKVRHLKHAFVFKITEAVCYYTGAPNNSESVPRYKEPILTEFLTVNEAWKCEIFLNVVLIRLSIWPCCRKCELVYFKLNSLSHFPIMMGNCSWSFFTLPVTLILTYFQSSEWKIK